MIRNKKILITGGLGFVGSNLASNLSAKNEVTILDNNIFRRQPDLSSQIEIIKKSAYSLSTESAVFDLIFHLGEYSRVEQSFSDVEIVLKNNIIATNEVIKYVMRTGAKLIYAGSSTKFADMRYSSPYSITKKYNAEMISILNDMSSIDAAITYFFNVYGPGENDDEKYGTVIGKFLRRYQENKPLEVTAPGHQERNFTHVNDIVSGLNLVALKGKGDNYQIGNPKKYKIIDVAKMISDNIILKDSAPGNRLDAPQDLTKIKSLGWQPEINLMNYIAQVKC